MTILIQLDKPVYRQGQTGECNVFRHFFFRIRNWTPCLKFVFCLSVKFRTIPINTGLRAFDDPVDVFMVDPNGYVMRRWLSRQTNIGTVFGWFSTDRFVCLKCNPYHFIDVFVFQTLCRCCQSRIWFGRSGGDRNVEDTSSRPRASGRKGLFGWRILYVVCLLYLLTIMWIWWLEVPVA